MQDTARRRHIGTAALLTVGAGVLAIGASAQSRSEKAPPRLVLEVESTLSSNDNYDLGATSSQGANTFDTSLGLTFNSVTRLQKLRFSAKGLARFSNNNLVTDSGFLNPSLNLDYERATEDAKLSFNGRYQQQRIRNGAAFATLPDGTLSNGAVVNNGTVSNSDFKLGYEVGLRAPVGFAFSAETTRRTFSGTSDPNAFDSRTQDFSTTLKMRPSEVTEIGLGLTYGTESHSGALISDSTTTGTQVTLSQELSPALKVEGMLGYRRIESTRSASGAQLVSSGVQGMLGVTRAMRTGSASARLETDRDRAGARNTFSLGTTYEGSRAGMLSAELGVTMRPGGTARPVGTLDYSHELPAGRYSLRVDRSIALNADEADVAYTQLGLNYAHRINLLSEVGLSLDWRRAEQAGSGTFSSTDRRTVRISYSHDMSRDWSVTTGYEYSRQDDVSGLSSSNSVFLTLGRSFTLLP